MRFVPADIKVGSRTRATQNPPAVESRTALALISWASATQILPLGLATALIDFRMTTQAISSIRWNDDQTALAPLYLAYAQGKTMEVFAAETRPLFQGSRLTAWEPKRAGLDVRVITDNMAGVFCQLTPPDLVFMGADRVARNGDMASKIGSYGLAVLAQHHGVPFYVLAPTSTIVARPSASTCDKRRPADVPLAMILRQEE